MADTSTDTHFEVLVINYGDRDFQYTLRGECNTWNHETYSNLVETIGERYDLTETFSIYEKVCGEQFIMDDIDDLIAIFDNEESDIDDDKSDSDHNPSNKRKYHIYVKDSEQIERGLWRINSFCLIYSRSKRSWFEAQIINIYGELHEEWLVVKYDNKSTKEIQRNSKDIKPIPYHHILSLKIGSKCLILSDYSHLWYLGQVISVLNDDEGEWLAIKYTENNLDKIADIQRFSKQLKVFTETEYNTLVTNRNNYEEKQQEPNTMISRIQALKYRMSDNDSGKEIKSLMKIFSNILKSPFNSKFQTLLMEKLKKKFTKYPICIELLYDAGFKKSKSGKKLTFNINNMKLLKKTDKALKEQFSELAQIISEEEKAEIAAKTAVEQHTIDPLIEGNFRGLNKVAFRGGVMMMSTSNGWKKVSLFG